MDKFIIFLVFNGLFFLFSCDSLFESKTKHLDSYIDSIYVQDLKIFNTPSQLVERLEVGDVQNRLWKDYWKKRDSVKLEDKANVSFLFNYWLELVLIIVLIILILMGVSLKKKIKKKKMIIDDTHTLFENVEDEQEQEDYIEEASKKMSLEESKRTLMQDFGISSDKLNMQSDLLDSFDDEEDDLDTQIRRQLDLQESSINTLQEKATQESVTPKNSLKQKPNESIPNNQDALDWSGYQKEEQIKSDILRFDKKGYTPSQISQMLKVDLRDVQDLLLAQKRNKSI